MSIFRVEDINPTRDSCSQHVAWLWGILDKVPSPVSDIDRPATYFSSTSIISLVCVEVLKCLKVKRRYGTFCQVREKLSSEIYSCWERNLPSAREHTKRSRFVWLRMYRLYDGWHKVRLVPLAGPFHSGPPGKTVRADGYFGRHGSHVQCSLNWDWERWHRRSGRHTQSCLSLLRVSRIPDDTSSPGGPEGGTRHWD